MAEEPEKLISHAREFNRHKREGKLRADFAKQNPDMAFLMLRQRELEGVGFDMQEVDNELATYIETPFFQQVHAECAQVRSQRYIFSPRKRRVSPSLKP